MALSRILLTCMLLAVAATGTWSQGRNVLTIGGGYSFANIEDIDTDGTGFRINVTYETYRPGESFTHGVGFGYINVGASRDSSTGLLGAQNFTVDYTVSSLPIYYAPKFMFGGESFKGFVHGALGIQLSFLQRTGSATGDVSSSDFGFYGGAGAGIMLLVSETVFISAEYEWAYLTNSYYRDGFMNSAMAGVGFRF